MVILVELILVVFLDLHQRSFRDSPEGVDGLSEDGHREAAALSLHRRHRRPSVVARVVPSRSNLHEIHRAVVNVLRLNWRT